MQYQNDYVLRLIEQMGDLVRRAVELSRFGSDAEPYELSQQALGLALDMDPDMTVRLAPQTLTSLLEIQNLDDRVIGLVAEALDLQGDVLERSGELVQSGVRREQAAGARSLLDPRHAN